MTMLQIYAIGAATTLVVLVAAFARFPPPDLVARRPGIFIVIVAAVSAAWPLLWSVAAFEALRK